MSEYFGWKLWPLFFFVALIGLLVSRRRGLVIAICIAGVIASLVLANAVLTAALSGLAGR